MLNLWNPSHLAFGLSLVTAFVLGIVHGVTPDEHTWPITFSYAVGSYSTRRGLRAGLIFSLSFTLQRAIASELAFLGLAPLMTLASGNFWVYLVVGAVMLGGGKLVLNRPRRILKAMGTAPDAEVPLQDPRLWMPAVHGFIAGWGFGAFAIIIYTVLAPAMPSAAWGWVPGALFGLGTTFVQALAGAGIGFWASRRGLDPVSLRAAALKTAGRTLFWGGATFLVAGLLGLLIPGIGNWTFDTGIRVHNLAHLGLAFAIVVFVVLGVGVGSFVFEIRKLGRLHPLSDAVAKERVAHPIVDSAATPMGPTGS
ncbi:MAG: hypothetical protein ACYCS1_11110 [Gammaproteobacteria bacterium]